VSISHQVVAGQNHFVHLLGEPDGKQYTATINQNLQGEESILEVSHGHNAHKHGHGHHH